ncbi:MAG: LEPR-XLL domain-containing protein, partial [Rhodocyclaceae bacterium]|nr:LEPR-XLL domain-containing protein [Rhodocyclaceae bacterium]
MLKLLSRLTRSFRPAGAASALPPRPLAEKLEPRLLYSADLMPVGLGADAALPGAETRVLDSDTSTWLDRATAQQSGG